MTKFMKTLAALAFLALSQFASANMCYTNVNQIPPGSPPLGMVNGMWCTGNPSGQQFQGAVIAQPAQVTTVTAPIVTRTFVPDPVQRQVIVQPIPSYQMVYGSAPVGVTNGNSNQCSGLLERIGRVAGANHGNDVRNTENAGFLGYLIGNVFCSSSRNVASNRVISAEEWVGGRVRSLPTASQQEQKSCTRFWSDGRREKKAVSSEAECDAFQVAGTRETIAEVATTTSTASGTQQRGKSHASVCTRRWSDGRVEQKEGLTSLQCDDYQAGKLN